MLSNFPLLPLLYWSLLIEVAHVLIFFLFFTCIYLVSACICVFGLFTLSLYHRIIVRTCYFVYLAKSLPFGDLIVVGLENESLRRRNVTVASAGDPENSVVYILR